MKDEEYTLALKAIPWTETLIGLPLIKDLNFKKPVGKTKAKTPEDFDKIDLTYHPNLPGFLSTAINIIIYIVLLAIALYVLLDLLILLPLFNLYTSYKYFGFLLYNRCPSCGRMHTLDTTDEG